MHAGQRWLFNPLDPTFKVDPYPHYKRLREEDPVHWSAFGAWYVGRYEDVRAILRDRRFSSQGVPIQIRRKHELLATRKLSERQPASLTALIASTPNWMMFKDAPDHTRLRRLVAKAFHARRVEEMRPVVRSWIETLIERVRPRGQMDVISEFAALIPMNAIGTMLGIPPHDFEKVSHWASRLARVFDPLVSLEEYEVADHAARDFGAYLRELIARRRAAPEADLLSALIAARDERDQLTEDELVATCIVTFGAGEESTVSMIGNGVLALLRNPEQTAHVRARPELMPSVVEELLRYDAPLQMTARMALEDVELGGKVIKQGSTAFVALGSANRDPDPFERPDELVWDRENNPHVAFGDGPHLCFGAPLARVEAQEAFRLLLEMLPDLELAGEERWREHSVIRCMTRLPVRFSP